MRIISGHFKGKNLTTPKDNSVRPTSDRAKQALFNIICHNYLSHNLVGIKVLDVFAGSGALGLEALSRGAEFAVFVDNGMTALDCLNSNIKVLNLQNKTKIIKSDIAKIKTSDSRFDLIFMDPPYYKDLIPVAINSLVEKNYIAENGLLVIETACDEVFEIPEFFKLLEERKYGAAKVWFLQLGKLPVLQRD